MLRAAKLRPSLSLRAIAQFYSTANQSSRTPLSKIGMLFVNCIFYLVGGEKIGGDPPPPPVWCPSLFSDLLEAN